MQRIGISRPLDGLCSYRIRWPDQIIGIKGGSGRDAFPYMPKMPDPVPPGQTESTPLLQEPAKPCWACWESAETYYNPLVRVCRGCKDPELQLIHQRCIDKYINALPTPRRCTR